MKYYSHLPYFLAVCRCGSFSKAAKLMNVTQSSVSYQIERLEELLATNLIVRSRGRKIQLTPNGMEFLNSLELADRAIQQVITVVGGNCKKHILQISAPTDLGATLLAPLLHQMQSNQLKYSLDLNDSVVDLVKNNIDLAIRRFPTGQSSHNEFGFCVKNVLVSSESYLQKNREPQTVRELLTHNVVLRNVHASLGWSGLLVTEGLSISDLSYVLTVNNSFGIASAVSTGAGLAILPEYIARHYGLTVLSNVALQKAIPVTYFEIVFIDTFVGRSYAVELKNMLRNNQDSLDISIEWN